MTFDVMGQHVKTYKPRTTLHSLLNRFTRQRYAFSPLQSAVVTGNKEFPDASFYQGAINWDIMRQKTDTVILRVGQNTWEDPQFKRNYSESKARQMFRGLYYFYDDRASPSKQGDTFLRAIGNDMPEMEVYADWEYVYGGSYGGLKNVVAFMEYIEARANVKTGIYSGYYFFRDHSNAITNASQYAYLKTRPLWLGWYTNNPAVVLIPAPWSELLLWQYGTPSIGLQYGVDSVEIDMNRVNLTNEQFYARYGHVSVPPPTGENMRYNFKSNIATETRSIRNGNGVTFTKTRDLPAGGGVVVDFIYTYPAAYAANMAHMGDKWAHIEGTNEWLAVIHQGKTYGVLTAIPETTEPRVVSTFATLSNTYVYEDGTQVTVSAKNVELK